MRLSTACIIIATVGSTAAFVRADTATPAENLEKLKGTNSCRGCDLSGLTLNRMEFSGADLEGADLSKTKFQLSNLSGANLRRANLRGASFGGTDLAEADLRGADLRGASLEGAYLDKTLLDGEFVTARPYEDIGVADVEKQVYVPNPDKPKKTPEPGDVKIAAQKEGSVAAPAPETEKASSGRQAAGAASGVTTEKRPEAPAPKKAIPVGQAIVEPPDMSSQTQQERQSASEPAMKAKGSAGDTGPDKAAAKQESGGAKMATVGKPSPKPPAEVILGEESPLKNQ